MTTLIQYVSDIHLETRQNTFANSNLTYLMGKNVKAWLCGHTHGCKQININGTQIATNTYGYADERIQGFSQSATLEI